MEFSLTLLFSNLAFLLLFAVCCVANLYGFVFMCILCLRKACCFIVTVNKSELLGEGIADLFLSRRFTGSVQTETRHDSNLDFK